MAFASISTEGQTDWVQEELSLFVSLLPDAAAEIIRHVSQVSGSETGGVLVGYYGSDHRRATITRAVGAPADSLFSWSTFLRGTRGLNKLLERIWRKQREYYLGEWHLHPVGPPVPSVRDIEQMKELAENPVVRCPEPILIVVAPGAEDDLMAACLLFLGGSTHPLSPSQTDSSVDAAG